MRVLLENAINLESDPPTPRRWTKSISIHLELWWNQDLWPLTLPPNILFFDKNSTKNYHSRKIILPVKSIRKNGKIFWKSKKEVTKIANFQDFSQKVGKRVVQKYQYTWFSWKFLTGTHPPMDRVQTKSTDVPPYHFGKSNLNWYVSFGEELLHF